MNPDARRAARRLIPWALRRRLYDWDRGRRVRWDRWPGVESVVPAGHAVLTFDDGPDVDSTPAVLDALDQIEATATFFVVAEHVVEHPQLAREIAARGHEIGLHGLTHARRAALDPERSRSEIVDGIERIASVTGQRPHWFRPPYGLHSDATAEACDEEGLQLVYWSAWGLDWEPLEPREIAQLVGRSLKDGAIVLLHDSARYAPRPSALPTAAAVVTLGVLARERALSFVALRDAGLIP